MCHQNQPEAHALWDRKSSRCWNNISIVVVNDKTFFIFLPAFNESLLMMRLNSLCTRKSAISRPYPLTEDVSTTARHPIAYSVPLLGRHSANPYDLCTLIAKLVGSAGTIPFLLCHTTFIFVFYIFRHCGIFIIFYLPERFSLLPTLSYSINT